MFSEVLEFWFEEIEPRQWWVKDAEFDAVITQRFGSTHQQANAGELHSWRATPKGRLAEIIVLDQFSRNIYRDNARAFASDKLAVRLVQQAIAAGADTELNGDERLFVYMPLMHSESLVTHRQAEKLFASLAELDQKFARNLDFEQRHKAIIERFGRYPHRNDILGRDSTAEELEFLQQPGSGF